MSTNQEARHTTMGKVTSPYNEAIMAFKGGTGTINERIIKYLRTSLALPTAGITELKTRDAINKGNPPYSNVRSVT